MGVVHPEVELEVAGQARTGQVRRAGDDALLVGEDERLAVDEVLGVPADLHAVAVEHVDHPLQPGIDLAGEPQQVAVLREVRIEAVERLLDAAAVVRGRPGLTRLAPPLGALLLRLGPMSSRRCSTRSRPSAIAK
jgi:hypothetical protein